MTKHISRTSFLVRAIVSRHDSVGRRDNMTSNAVQKKKHHYSPVTYLKGFTGPSGKVFAWRKDDPEVALHKRPESIGLERYYYSRPLPDGGRDNNSLEDFFSTIEQPWPQLMERLRTRMEEPSDFLPLIEFLMLQRIRVPCVRDAVELHLAELVKTEARVLDEAGRLPPKPAGFEDILDRMEVSIDPHMSIHALSHLSKGLALVVDACVFQVLHNETDIDFLTSDNPVAVFDSTVPEAQMRPYQISRDFKSVELLFPLTSRMILRGVSGMRPAPGGVKHLRLASEQDVKRMNRLGAKFGYRFVFANSAEFAPLVKKHAALSPVSRFERWRDSQGGYNLSQESVWGPRPTKPKWTTAE